VSTDGRVIIGQARNGDRHRHAAAWVNGEIIDLGTLGGTSSDASAVSADGIIIVGKAQHGDTGPLAGRTHAVAWEVGPDGITTAIDLGTLGGTSSDASAVSADGIIIVGKAQHGDTGPLAGRTHAVAWEVGPDGITTAIDLGTLGGTSSDASAVNADGIIIVGKAQHGDTGPLAGRTHAVAWEVGLDGITTAIDLGTLGGTSSEAVAVSADGSVIVGEAKNADGDFHVPHG
jgi:probable HAF family extracellular repeat protein